MRNIASETTKEVLAIKFVGEDLDLTSVPIYELGEVFIAYQRIIYKIFLFENRRLKKGAKLLREERQRMALQVLDRRKESDLWALVPFISEPAVIDTIRNLVNASLIELGRYALQSLFGKDEESGRPTGSQITGAIHAETVTITNHIYNIGNIERVEFHGGANISAPPVIFTGETRDFVRDVPYQTYEGPPQEIQGTVTKLFPNRLIAEVCLRPGQYVKVNLSDDTFNDVRYRTGQGDLVTFLGRPVYRLGKDDFEEFQADKLVSTEQTQLR
ncbi:hypothetical protein KA005_54500 [bacterium]|nr:hypothetical protein [bacterium]